MRPPDYDETQLQPLRTDAEIERRVDELIGRANSRRLWLLFLDASDVQLPVLIPLDDLPAQPTTEQAIRVLEVVRELMGEIDAAAVITVLERYGPIGLTPQDAAWNAALRNAAREQGIALRAQLLSHRSGVRQITVDELSGYGDGDEQPTEEDSG